MSRSSMRQDKEFWQIVKDMQWKLDDGRTGHMPVGEPEFGYGSRVGRLPAWTTHAVAFLLGSTVVGFLLALLT
jgi:hypothetical protein